MDFLLNKFEFPFPKDALCTVWLIHKQNLVEISTEVLEEILKVGNVFSVCGYQLNKFYDPTFVQT